MSWLASIFTGILSGALGLVAAGFVANACVHWYRISGFEGKSGYFVVFTALFGGFLAFVAGIVISRIVAAHPEPGFWKALGFSALTVLAVAGIAALVSWLLADIAPEIDGQELMLEVEYRLPAGQIPPQPPGPPTAENADERAKHSFTLGSVVDHVQRAARLGVIDFERARLEDGRWIVPASVYLFTTRGLRSIDLTIGGTSVGGFIVPLPGRPGREHLEWSQWGPRPRPPAEPWPDTKASYRFRVARIAPPPPGPTYEELQAAERAKEQAAFDAIPPDAPIAAWFPYTRYGSMDERRGKAVDHIVAKPGYADELGALMNDADPRTAAEALYLVEYLPADAAISARVLQAGKQLAARMRTVNATTPEQDPGYEGAADVSIRYSAWMVATRALRANGAGDFVPELREILALSRVRTDSYVMQQDVRRVASYYAKEWAGIAPEPGDPPPR